MRVPDSRGLSVGIGGGGLGAAPLPTASPSGAQNRGSQQLAHGLDTAVSTLGQFEIRQAEARRKRDLAHGRVEMERLFQGLTEQYQNDQDFKTAPERWEQDIQTAKQQFLESVGDERLRADLALDFEMSAIRYGGGLRKDLFQREKAFTLAQFDADTEHYVNTFINAPDEATAAAQRQEFHEALEGVSDFAGMAEVVKRRDAFDDTARFGRAMRIAESGDHTSIKLDDYADLSPDQAQSLRLALEKREQDELVNSSLAGLEGLPYEEQLKRVRGIKDKTARNDVLAEINKIHAIEERIETKQRVDLYDTVWERAVDTAQGKADKPVSVVEIRALDLKPAQKEHLLNIITKDKPDENTKALELYAYGLERRINQSDVKVDDQFIWKEYIEGRLTKEGKTHLLSAWKNQKTLPDLGRAKELLLNEFPETKSTKTQEYTLPGGQVVETTPKARFLASLNAWTKQFKDDHRRNPNYDEVITMGRKIMKPEVEGSWWFNSGEVEAPYITGKTQRDFKAEAIAADVGGEVQWDDEHAVFYWQRGNYLYTENADGQRLRKKLPKSRTIQPVSHKPVADLRNKKGGE